MGLAGAVAAAGVCIIIIAMLVPAREGAASPGLLAQLAQRWRRLAPSQQRMVMIGLAGGVVVTVVIRWLPALIIVPLLVIVVPFVLSDPHNREVAVLEALDRWVRGLTASLLTGRSVLDAIRSTRSQAPAVIAEAVTLLAARLDERWPLPDALAGFATDVDHADADAVAAALIVAGQRGTAAAATLEALADAVQDRLAAARDMENERAKPRIVVRQVTAITGVVMGLALVTSPSYFEPYRSGFGPLLASVLVLAFVGTLAKLRVASQPAPRARIHLATVNPAGVRDEVAGRQ